MAIRPYERNAAMSITRYKFIWCIGIAMLLAACGGSSTAPTSDKIVEGVDFTQLFAPPTATEVSTVESMWDTRDVSAQGIQEITSAPATFGSSPATIRIVSHTVDGVRHVGAIAYATDAGPATLPILAYIHGGDEGENLNDVLGLIAGAFGGIPNDYVYVVPSLRAESLAYNNTWYVSEGPPSPYQVLL